MTSKRRALHLYLGFGWKQYVHGAVLASSVVRSELYVREAFHWVRLGDLWSRDLDFRRQPNSAEAGPVSKILWLGVCLQSKIRGLPGAFKSWSFYIVRARYQPVMPCRKDNAFPGKRDLR